MRSTFHFSLILGFIIVFAACKKAPEKSSLFQLKQNTGINFSNNIYNTKDFNIFSYRNFYNGGGVAIGDINNDGLADVFFTANMGSNKLYLNKGNFQFDDVTDKAGLSYTDKWSTGVVMADVNNDGWLDIYVCNAGYINGKAPESKLYINNHNLTFTDSAAEYGLTNKGGYATHAAFFDYDLDGDLDCFIINNSFLPVNTLNYVNKRDLRAENWPVPDFLKGGGDHLYRNDNGKFVDVSKNAGIHGTLISFGLGISVGDVNGDHYPDVYVSNDFFERDYLYINQKDGTFKDELEQRLQHTSLASMGSDMADINNDGYADIFTTDMLPDDDYRLKTTTSFENIDVYKLKERSGFYHQFQQNALQLNNHDGTFSDVANYSGVSASDWSWGALFFDADNDGLNDIYVCNGIKQDVTDQDFIDFFGNDVVQKMVLTGKKEEVDNIVNKMPANPIANKFFKNLGDARFEDAGKAFGFTQPSFSNGAAYGDLDNDGDLDLVINNVNQPAFIYQNNSRQMEHNNFISVVLKGSGKNTFAIGSSIKLYVGNQILSADVMPSRGFQSSVDYKKTIGIGKASQIDSMMIVWPNRTYSMYVKPAINVAHVYQQPANAPLIDSVKSQTEPTLLTQIASNFDKHTEDDYSDFYYERNIPRLLSAEGPKAAYGDVNGDGLDDVYIGGASGQAGQLYLQTKNGFVKKNVNAFKAFAENEDVAVLFFDCDGDGDLDLVVGSGGNNSIVISKPGQTRLYLNDGKGNFTIAKDALPATRMNTSVIINNDFDNDGDQDLFVGSRSVPMHYGLDPQSYFYLNDGKGHFTQMPADEYAAIANIGMVTGAVWANVTGNSNADLIVVGEWMSPRIFEFTAGKFSEVKTNMNNLFGWWQNVTAADVDGDGNVDLVLSNIGANFYLKPSEKTPVKLWLGDFDNDYNSDAFISRTVDGKDVPVFLKRDITDQFPFLKKENLHYKDFALKTVTTLFSKNSMKNVEVKQFNYPYSCIAYGNGKGNFNIQILPERIQLSSMNVARCLDINNDGRTDIVSGGNQFGFPPQFGRLDASCGDVLINEGNRKFSWLGSSQSGLNLRGEVRDIVALNNTTNRKLLFLQNNGLPALYSVKPAKPKAR